MYSEFFPRIAFRCRSVAYPFRQRISPRKEGLFLECSRAYEVRFDLEGIPSRAARQKDAKRIMKRKERKEDGVKFPRGARVWDTKILAEEGTSIENKRWSETKDGAGMSRGRSEKRERRRKIGEKGVFKGPSRLKRSFHRLIVR